jgi:hypothetical protein
MPLRYRQQVSPHIPSMVPFASFWTGSETLLGLVIDGGEGYAQPDGPAKHETVPATPETVFTVPAASIVVLRGEIGPKD